MGIANLTNFGFTSGGNGAGGGTGGGAAFIAITTSAGNTITDSSLSGKTGDQVALLYNGVSYYYDSFTIAGTTLTMTIGGFSFGAGDAALLQIAGTGSGGSSSLAGLSDVSLTTLNDGQVLTYDSSINKWTNENSSGTPIDLYFEAWVDTQAAPATGTLGSPATPFPELDDVITAANNVDPDVTLVINISLGDYNCISNSLLRGNLILNGAARPKPDITVSIPTLPTTGEPPVYTMGSPTKLINGTVLKGGMVFHGMENIQIRNLGIDQGSAYVNGDPAKLYDCLVFSPNIVDNFSVPPYNLNQNIVVENVSLLQTESTTAFHCLIFQGCYEATYTNVYTYFGFAGVVDKSIGTKGTKVFMHGHGTQSFFAKTNNYSLATQNSLSDFRCSSIQSNDGSGIRIDSSESLAGYPYVQITNGMIFGTTSGYYQFGGPNMQYMSVSNLIIANISGIGVNIPSGGGVAGNFSGIKVVGCTNNGFTVSLGTGNALMSLFDCEAYNCGGDGFNITAAGGTRVDINNLSAAGNTGYGLNIGSNVYGIVSVTSGNCYTSILNTAGQINGTINPR